MNDIVLLMTGVLITRQPSPSHLPKQPVIQLDNGVQKLTQNHIISGNSIYDNHAT